MYPEAIIYQQSGARWFPSEHLWLAADRFEGARFSRKGEVVLFSDF